VLLLLLTILWLLFPPKCATVFSSQKQSILRSHSLQHSQIIPLLQVPLLDTLLSCVPAHPTCLDLLPAIVMDAAQLLAPPDSTNSLPLRAIGALAGWCAEGWLLANRGLMQRAARSLVTALFNHCTHMLL
jgi:hypothetical protein